LPRSPQDEAQKALPSLWREWGIYSRLERSSFLLILWWWYGRSEALWLLEVERLYISISQPCKTQETFILIIYNFFYFPTLVFYFLCLYRIFNKHILIFNIFLTLILDNLSSFSPFLG
jgi:hypothetical protein